MHATLLVLLATAWLNVSALDFFLVGSGSRREALASATATGAVLLLAVAVGLGGLPADWPLDAAALSRYLALFAFFAVLLQSCRPLPPLDATTRRRWRRFLPLIVANLAVLACATLGPAWLPDARVAIATAAVASCAMLLLAPIGVAFLDRLRLDAAPPALRGAPLALLSAATAALGASGWAPLLPW